MNEALSIGGKLAMSDGLSIGGNTDVDDRATGIG
jgi:hypothetical protein